MASSKQINSIDTPENRNRLLAKLTGAIGATNAIGMGELYEAVFDRPWHNRINDTRDLRKLVTIMRDENVAICSVSAKGGGGYYLAAAGSELAAYLARNEKKAMRILKRNSGIKRVSLPNYLGQIQIAMEGGNGQAA